MNLLKTNTDPAVTIARLVVVTNARVKGGLHAERLESLRDAVTNCLAAFCADERAVVREACTEAAELAGGEAHFVPVLGDDFDALAVAREPAFFWSVRSAAAITQAPAGENGEVERARIALSLIDKAFSSYTSAWADFINELCAEITSCARVEAESLVPALIAFGRMTNAANAERTALALKSIEKEDRRIGEIFAMMNWIPEHF
jgi:hypothetical protein